MDITIILIIGILSFIGLLIIFYYIPIGTYFHAITHDVNISLLELIFMRFRKTPVQFVIELLIISHNNDLNLSKLDLEAHYLAGGDISKVVMAMIEAQEAGISLSFKEATAIDLSGKDINELMKAESKD